MITRIRWVHGAGQSRNAGPDRDVVHSDASHAVQTSRSMRAATSRARNWQENSPGAGPQFSSTEAGQLLVG
jgi:hypothetical protein